MPDQDPEAVRLADQRTEDLASISARELEAAKALGKKEALDEVFQAETRGHFRDINGSQAAAARELKLLSAQLGEIKADLAARDKVNVALIEQGDRSGSQRLTRFQMTLLLCAGLISLGSLILAITQAVG
jgi:hypothetical protein